MTRRAPGRVGSGGPEGPTTAAERLKLFLEAHPTACDLIIVALACVITVAAVRGL